MEYNCEVTIVDSKRDVAPTVIHFSCLWVQVKMMWCKIQTWPVGDDLCWEHQTLSCMLDPCLPEKTLIPVKKTCNNEKPTAASATRLIYTPASLHSLFLLHTVIYIHYTWYNHSGRSEEASSVIWTFAFIFSLSFEHIFLAGCLVEHNWAANPHFFADVWRGKVNVENWSN